MLNHQLKIAVLCRSGRRFKAKNDVLSAKVNELSAMMYCIHGPKKDLLNINCRTKHVGNHIFGSQTIDNWQNNTLT